MSAVYQLAPDILAETFAHFRDCGRGRHECQVLWVSSWDSPETITEVVHPKHAAHAGGFVLDDHWLNDFWFTLARRNLGIRVQVHTHPSEAFHSPIDDQFPIIHSVGFLSLVIPDFSFGPIGFDDAYLAVIKADERWCEAVIAERLILK